VSQVAGLTTDAPRPAGVTSAGPEWGAVHDDLPGPEDDPPLDDLDAGLRDRLRRARGAAGGLTHAELVELADALDRQRRQVAGALADLRRREEEAARMRAALEQTSREAAHALDERDARLTSLAAELAAERERLDARARELDAAQQAVAQRRVEPVEQPGTIESVLGDLRQRLERVEAVLELRERLERVETAIAERVRTVREQAPSQLEERLARLEELVGELARLVRRPHEEAPAPEPEPDPVEPVGEAPAPDPQPAPSAPAAGYVLFVATSSGYRMLEREGAPPRVGEHLELDGTDASVTASRSSPLPRDERPCLVCLVDERRTRRSESREPGSQTEPGSVFEPGS
jgi:hypothetical protein